MTVPILTSICGSLGAKFALHPHKPKFHLDNDSESAVDRGRSRRFQRSTSLVVPSLGILKAVKEVVMSKIEKGKWFRTFVVVCCLSCAAFAKKDIDDDKDNDKDKDKCHPTKNCVQVPESGSAAIYLLGAGLTCVGAMLVRSKLAKPAQE